MKKLALVLAVLLLITACEPVPQAVFETNSGSVSMNLEIVDTLETREMGLMFRESLPKNNGMLFVFEKNGIYPFWMKNTLIPLDMIFIAPSGEIVDIQQAVPCEADPCASYVPQAEHLYVIEANAGFSEENGIEIGNYVKLP